MKILFVLNNFYTTGNGLAASARRTVAALKEAGEEVRVLSGPNHNPDGPQPEYALKDFYFPLFQPIIARGPITGTYQFALDERSRFHQKDALELAGKIDWWLDHPAEMEAMREAYVNEMKNYSIDLSVRELMKMFRNACELKR